MDARLQRLLGIIRDSILCAVPEKRIGVAFSGGVDSALVSHICADLGYDVDLLTVGFSGSHDIAFAGKVGALMDMPHHVLEIDPGTFPQVSRRIEAAVGARSMSWLENCIAFYYVSLLASKRGLCTVVAANGIDELFCGYDAYRRAMPCDDRTLAQLVDQKLENELRMMEAVGSVASEHGVRLVQPLLSGRFVQHARTIPIHEKIRGPDDHVRKHIIRELAGEVGVPRISYTKRKKALQYGSKIHKELIRIRRTFSPGSAHPCTRR